jgi:hypothetical protein
MAFGFKEDDSERGNDASEDRRIHRLVIVVSSDGFSQRIGIDVRPALGASAG